MEASLEAAEVLAPRPDLDSNSPEGGAAAPPAASSSSSSSSSSSERLDPMQEFRRRLDDIISAHGSAVLLQAQSGAEPELLQREPREDVPVAMETEVCLIMKSLSQLSSPQQKLEDVVRKNAELAAQRRSDEKKLCVLQQKLSVLQEEQRSGLQARSQLETLCREQQGHYSTLTEQTVQRCREEEEKRKDMTNHFQTVLTEIQAQIEQHSSRNDKLCLENSNLTAKLEALMGQCEMREESLEKLNKHRDLQHKLTEAKLQQANAQLAEAEDKHKREKEYLLREAIEKTKKCFAMKEQELAMKKKLTLYGQKFDEFQTTLAKSNEIYVRFKKEMDNMSDKMKKMEKESNLWRTRFENCNKALTTMIEERAEKSHEYDVFVLKILKLEKLCRALQDERAILYEKIKEVRKANSSIPSKVFSSSDVQEAQDSEGAALLTPEDLQELQELQMGDPVLTANMSRLKDEQAKLQEFADSLLATPEDHEEEQSEDVEPEEDLVSFAMVQFKTQVKEVAVEVQSEPAEPTPVENAPETIPTDAKPEAQTQIQEIEVQPVKPEEEIQPKPAEPQLTAEPEEVKMNPPTDPKPEAATEIPVEAAEVKPEQVQAEPGAAEAQIPVKPEQIQAEPRAAEAQIPVKPEQIQAEPGAAEAQIPVKPEQIQAEPGAAEAQIPVKPEQIQAEPGAAEAQIPVKPEQVQAEPGAAEAQIPVKPEQVQAEPGAAEAQIPVKPEQVQAEPGAAEAQIPVKPDQVQAEPGAAEAQIPVKPEQVQAEPGAAEAQIPVKPEQVQAEPRAAAAKTESAPSSENTPQTSSSSNGESSKKQTPKKKKKRNGKSSS